MQRSDFKSGFAALVGLAALCLAQAPSLARSSWAIDPQRTRIAFSIDATGYPKTEGVFHKFVGRIAIDFDNPKLSRVSFDVQSASVDAGSAGFNDYISSNVLLDAQRFPQMSFTSRSVEKLDDSHVRVSGDLTLLGVTRPLDVEVVVERRPGAAKARLGFIAHAKIDRLDFGMNSGYPLISRQVDLTISSEAVEG